MNALVIGTRGSDLALWQANFIRDTLTERYPDLRIDLKIIRTQGDRVLDTPLHKMLDKGLFTTEIENELSAGTIDLAVHSLKDLPTQLASGLTLADVGVREDPADVLLSKSHTPLDDLPPGATVLAGSLRRTAQLLHRRPDLSIAPIRGNVPARVRKFKESDADGMVMARAGLVRLGLAGEISQRLDPAEFVSACGQGALAIEIRADRPELGELLGVLDDPPTRWGVAAERTYLAELGGGCQVPVGAYARPTDDGAELAVTGVVADLDGRRLLKETVRAPVADTASALALGRSLADTLRRRGCQDILDDVLAQTQNESESDR